MTSKDVVQAYKIVFNSDAGRIVLEDLMAAHCITATMLQPGQSTEDFYVKEGGRNAVLRILAILGKRITLE